MSMTQVLVAKHVISDIYLDEHGKIIEHPSKKKVPVADESSWPLVLKALKDPKYFSRFRQKNIDATKLQIKGAQSKDILIISAISAVEEFDHISNMIVKRLREWAGWWVPETSREVKDNAAFCRLISECDQKSLLEKGGSSLVDSMGWPLEVIDFGAIKNQAMACQQILAYRDRHELYIRSLMQQMCPNLHAVAGDLIGSKLIAHAGSLKRLSEMPSSTIQVLGAEKALFRHLKTGAKPPKYGVIFSHPLIQSAKRLDQGKISRALADKISIAVKVDYFKGQFVGDKLKKELEGRFGR